MQFAMIDVLRGFAALTVLVYHTIAHMNWTDFPIQGPLLWFRIGWMGVDLFFVISGLVISLSAFSMLEKSSAFYLEFAAHRLSRIVPLYYATCLFFLMFISPEILFQSGALKNIGAHLLFIHNMNESYQGAIDGSNWSLGVEMQFYVFIMLCAPLLRKMPWWGIAVGCVSIAWAWRLYAFSTTSITGPLGPYPRFWKVTQLPGNLDEFAVGMCLARILVTDRGKMLLAFGQRYALLTIVVATGAMWGVLAFYWRYDANFWNSHVMVIPYRTALAAAFGCVVFAACCIKGRVMLFITAPARYLGTISYGIYLWQLPVILALKRLPWLTAPNALPVVLGMTVLLSACSYHFFEKPIMDKTKLFLKQRRDYRVRSAIVAQDLNMSVGETTAVSGP
jgi:peptidoglycan/LPS O-acetylase OafA/YrhL